MTGKFGASWFHRTGRWHIIEQVVDRRNNRYKKKIVDEVAAKGTRSSGAGQSGNALGHPRIVCWLSSLRISRAASGCLKGGIT